MDEILTRFVTDLVARLSGPLTLRLFLQPAVAILLAVRDGIQDAQDGRPPHFWRMVTGSPEARRRRARETWKSVLKVFVMAVVLDCVYQVLAFEWIYPFEALLTAVLLAIVPYVLVRGLANRIARRSIAAKAAQLVLVLLFMSQFASTAHAHQEPAAGPAETVINDSGGKTSMATRWPNIRFIWSHGGGTLIGLMTDSSRGADVLNGFE